jgi:Lrp/AsnC family transcriptional regulator for asnA, asnC and gidA
MGDREPVADAQAVRLDDLDLEILRAFRFGGRASNSEIARQVGVSEGTVRRRIAALEQLDVLRFVAITDPKTLGLNLNALIGIRADGDKVMAIARQLAELPEVPYVSLSIGSFDIWITALLPSADAWLDFRGRIAQIDGIRSTETFQVTRVIKQNFDSVVTEAVRIGDGQDESLPEAG